MPDCVGTQKKLQPGRIIGAIGGFILSGIIGLFVGAIIFALGYKLFLAWLNEGLQSEEKSRESE